MTEGVAKFYKVTLSDRETVQLSVLLALTTAGLEFGRIGRDSVFIDSVGAQSIPYMYMLDGVFMVLASLLLSVLARKINPRLLSIWLYGLAAPVAIVLGLLMFVVESRVLLSYVIFSLYDVILLLLLLGFWGSASSIISAQKGKSTFPIVGGCGLLGTCIGALAANQLIGLFGVELLFLIWALLLIVSWRVQALHGRGSPQQHDCGDVDLVPSDDTTMLSICRVPLIRTLAFMSLPMWIIIYVIEFYYLSTMDAVFDDQDSLAHFMSMVAFVSTLIGFFIQVFITPRLLRFLGIGSTNLIYHFSLTAGAASLLIYSLIPIGSEQLVLPGVAIFVVLSRFLDVAVFFSIYDSSSQLIYYSLSDKLMQRGKIFISGTIVPISTILAGSILVAFEHYQMPIYSVAFMAVMMGFMLLIISLNITPEYLSSLIANVTSDDTYKQEEINTELLRMEMSDARYVLLQSVTSDNETEALFALDKLWCLSGAAMEEHLPEDLQEALPEMQTSTLLAMQKKLCRTDSGSQLSENIESILQKRAGR